MKLRSRGRRLHSRGLGFGAYAIEPTNHANMPRIVHVLAFDNAQVLDVTGPLQVFASANDLARQRGLPLPYAVTVIADQAGPVMTSAGLALVAEPLPAVADTPVGAAGGAKLGVADTCCELADWAEELYARTT